MDAQLPLKFLQRQGARLEGLEILGISYFFFVFLCRFKFSIVESFIQQIFISIYYVPGTIVVTRDTTVSEADKNPCPHKANMLVGKERQQTNQQEYSIHGEKC